MGDRIAELRKVVQGRHASEEVTVRAGQLEALLDVAEAGRRLADAVDTFRFAYRGDLGHIVIPDALAEMEDAARAWTAALARLDGGGA